MEDVIGGHGLPHLTGEDVCVVVDNSGVHRLRVRPCWCGAGGPLDLQFMDMRLFPASLKKIQTTFTFRVLDDFWMDNLECKTAGLRYFNKLKRLTWGSRPLLRMACTSLIRCNWFLSKITYIYIFHRDVSFGE
jgi:hypothetical protein